MIGDALHIDKELLRLNISVPVKRRTLVDYLDNGDLSYVTRDGNRCDIDAEELKVLSEVCTEIEKMRVRLPILVSSDASGEGTAWRVDGVAESAVVARLLGKTRRLPDSVRFFNPDLHNLRKKLPTCTFIVFSV
ncbi:MAG: DUF61 family protein [Candidatus Methanomethylophilaceae archaeon]|nr:DUF61 family protein [Candidatus Methanomethylophilaceae archaeon]